MKKCPEISVILPVYNMERYLEQCLDSLLTQSFNDIEIICINDGSKDNSLGILNDYAKKDQRVIVINQENKGAASARNIGLDYARGKYLSILDADDFYDRDMLLKAYLKAEGTEADIVIYRCNDYNDQTEETTPNKWSIIDRLIPGEIFSVQEVSECVFQFCVGWAWDKLFNRAFIEINHLRFQNTKIHNDAFFVFVSLSNASRIVVMNDVLITKRRAVNTSISSTSNISTYWKDLFIFIDTLDDYLTSHHIKTVFERSFYNLALHLAINRYNSNLSKKSKKAMKKYLRKVFFPKYQFRKKGIGYYYNKNEYNAMISILSPSFMLAALRFLMANGFIATMKKIRTKLFH